MQRVNILTEAVRVIKVKSTECLLLQTQAVTVKGSGLKSTCPQEAIMLSVASKRTEYPLKKSHKMPTKDLVCSAFTLTAWKSARQTFFVLIRAKRQEERSSGPTPAKSPAQRAHKKRA